MLVTFSNK